MYNSPDNNMGNQSGYYPAYSPAPDPGKSQFGLALSAAIAGVVGIVSSLLLFANAVSGNSNNSAIPTNVQNIILAGGLVLIVVSGIFALLGIIFNKSRIACIVIAGVMALPIMIALFLLAVGGLTLLGIG